MLHRRTTPTVSGAQGETDINPIPGPLPGADQMPSSPAATPRDADLKTQQRQKQLTPLGWARLTPPLRMTTSPTVEAIEKARKQITFNFFKEVVEDPLTATALIQAIRKSKFAFPVGQGVTKKCGDDFIKAEVSKTAKVRRLKIRNKGKGVGKKSNKDRGTARHDSAQDQKAGEMRDAAQEQDVLDGEISKAETENLYADNNNKSKAGPSGQRREKNEERGCKKEKVEKVEKGTDKTNGKPDRKRRSSPKQGRINFFQEKGTPNAKLAEQENIAPLSWCKDSQANT